jgi:hypothetical protein
MQNTKKINQRIYYRRPPLASQPGFASGSETAAAKEQINLSIRIPLPDINRRRLFHWAGKLFITLAASVGSLYLLYKALWFIFNHST